MQSPSNWTVGVSAWNAFVQSHPELGLRPGRWPFHNFLRFHRSSLVAADAIRLARKRFWIAHLDRFDVAAFECATGKFPSATGVNAGGAL
jgi:hypothetical protein